MNKLSNFKIENFCKENNKEFKLYYNYLNNPVYLSLLLTCLKYINHVKIQEKILEMIKQNHNLVLDKLNKIDIIISYYIQNNLINKSEIGKFFYFYKNIKKNTDINNYKDLLELFNRLISYERFISVLKECFYIFSDYRACIYFMTPSIDFYDTKKNIIENVIINFRDNINTLNQIISKVYLGDKNQWGSIYYSTAYSMFYTLLIIKKYYENPLDILNIKLIIKKKLDNNKIIKELCEKFNNIKLKDSKNLSVTNIYSISQLIIILKKEGYDLWFVIPFVFNIIYKNYEIIGLDDSEIIGNKKIYLQKSNNKIGLMCYILSVNGYITNINIFKNFND
jgi:hypothetical protein